MYEQLNDIVCISQKACSKKVWQVVEAKLCPLLSKFGPFNAYRLK